MLRFGLIGAGRIGHVHARSISNHPDATLTLIADPQEESALALAKTYGVRHSSDVSSVFNATDVDALVICSPTPMHVPHILAAVAAGKPALCEKPVALDTGDADELLRKLGRNDVPVMIGFNRRFDPSFRAIHEAVTSGRLGTLEQLTIISRDPAAPPKEYIATSGGIFKDMTIHDFDTARYFLGDIVAVHAVGQTLDPALADTGDFDGAVITLVNAEGHTATITNSRHCTSGYDQRLEAFGSLGTMFAENIRPTTVRYSDAHHTNAEEPYVHFFLERYAAAYSAELSEFISAVTQGRPPSPSVADGVAALYLAEAAARSAHTGCTVRLD